MPRPRDMIVILTEAEIAWLDETLAHWEPPANVTITRRDENFCQNIADQLANAEPAKSMRPVTYGKLKVLSNV